MHRSHGALPPHHLWLPQGGGGGLPWCLGQALKVTWAPVARSVSKMGLNLNSVLKVHPKKKEPRSFARQYR
jgi:hypothetical protein